MMLLDWLSGKVPWGINRSKQWPETEKKFKAHNPQCAVCGCKKKLEVHHKQPFHLNPALELDWANLITLCRPHHYTFGHLDSWKSYNATVQSDAGEWLTKIEARP